jgi:hypothetical protein
LTVAGPGWRDAADARVYNRSLIFRSIWDNRGISRAELARLTNVSAPVAGRIVGELQTAGLLHEEGSSRITGGRPGAALHVEERSRFTKHQVTTPAGRYPSHLAINAE